MRLPRNTTIYSNYQTIFLIFIIKNLKLFSLSYDINQFLLLLKNKPKNKNNLSKTPSPAIFLGFFFFGEDFPCQPKNYIFK